MYSNNSDDMSKIEYDEFTGLISFSNFQKETIKILESSSNDRRYAIFAFDVNRLGIINATLGREVGDKIIKNISSIAKKYCRYGEILTRVSADNFCMLVYFNHNEELIARIKTIDKLCKKIIDGQTIYLSYGVYPIFDKSVSFFEMYECAMTMKRSVKGNYNNNIGFYDVNTTKKMGDSFDIIGKLEDAIKDKEFIILYQPKYDIETRKIAGSEALVRWKKSDSEIKPDVFIHTLENTGQIVDLDWYVFENVCKYLQKRLKKGKKCVPISVNFSRIHTFNDAFIFKLNEITHKYSIPRKLIELEITESSFSTDYSATNLTLKKIRNMGYHISIDDFGSGYSMLSMMSDLPADVLKIDKSFLSQKTYNVKSNMLIKSIVEVAKKMGLITVVEGVETVEQLEYLEKIGCDMVQGYIFSNPLSEEKFSTLLNENVVKKINDNKKTKKQGFFERTNLGDKRHIKGRYFNRITLLIIMIVSILSVFTTSKSLFINKINFNYIDYSNSVYILNDDFRQYIEPNDVIRKDNETFYYDVTERIENAKIAFKTNCQSYRIFINNREISNNQYYYTTKSSHKSYKDLLCNTMCIETLPNLEKYDKIKIELQSNNSKIIVPNVLLAPGDGVIYTILLQLLPTLSLLLLLLIVGAISLIYTLRYLQKKMTSNLYFQVCCFALISFLWILNDSWMVQTLTSDIQRFAVFDYAMFMVLPCPIIFFAKNYVSQKYKKTCNALVCVHLLNLIVCMFLEFFKILSPMQSVPVVSHILMIITSIILCVILYNSKKEHRMSKRITYVYIIFSLIVLFTIITYYIDVSIYDVVFKLSFAGFIIVFLNIAIHESVETEALFDVNNRILMNEQRLEIALSHSSTMIMEKDLKTGRIVPINFTNAECDIIPPCGYTDYNEINKITHPNDRDVIDELDSLICQGKQVVALRARLHPLSGNIYHWYSISSTSINDFDGIPLKAIITIEDVSENVALENRAAKVNELGETTKQLKETLDFQNRVFDLLHGTIYDLFFDYDVKADIMTYTRLNDNGKQVKTEIPDYLKYNSQSLIIHPDDIEQYQAEMFNAMQFSTRGTYEYRAKYVGEKWHWYRNFYISLADNENTIYRVIGRMNDISNERDYKEKAEIDFLTQVYNRFSCEQIVNEKLSVENPNGAFILIDINDFKGINDKYGHLIGDMILKKLSQEAKETFLKTDIVFRIGGDEFVIWMDNIVDNNKLIIKRINELNSAMCAKSKNEKMHVTVSAGIAYAKSGMKFSDIYKMADEALYAAKTNKNCNYKFYE